MFRFFKVLAGLTRLTWTFRLWYTHTYNRIKYSHTHISLKQSWRGYELRSQVWLTSFRFLFKSVKCKGNTAFVNKYLNDFTDLWSLGSPCEARLNTKSILMFTNLQQPNMYTYYPTVTRTRFFFDDDTNVPTKLLIFYIESLAIIILKCR
jgi:hypothetical protein